MNKKYMYPIFLIIGTIVLLGIRYLYEIKVFHSMSALLCTLLIIIIVFMAGVIVKKAGN